VSTPAWSRQYVLRTVFAYQLGWLPDTRAVRADRLSYLLPVHRAVGAVDRLRAAADPQ
jgi:hypothetical protein